MAKKPDLKIVKSKNNNFIDDLIVAVQLAAKKTA